MGKGITLVLGGTGLKGISHIGTLQTFKESGVPLAGIVASGTGALAAVQFSLGKDLNALTAYFVEFFTRNHHHLWGLERPTGMSRSRTRRIRDSFSYFLRERLFCQANFKRLSLLDWDLLEGDLSDFFEDADFDKLRIPLQISVVDLQDGKEVLLKEGTLIEQMKASVAFPGLFPPVRIGDREYVSSTFYCELPLGCLQDKDRPIWAVDIAFPRSAQRPTNVLETLARMDELRNEAIKRRMLSKADRVLALESFKGFPWGNYKQITLQVARARIAVERLLTLDPH